MTDRLEDRLVCLCGHGLFAHAADYGQCEARIEEWQAGCDCRAWHGCLVIGSRCSDSAPGQTVAS